jgi:hypothetical protein
MTLIPPPPTLLPTLLDLGGGEGGIIVEPPELPEATVGLHPPTYCEVVSEYNPTLLPSSMMLSP